VKWWNRTAIYVIVARDTVPENLFGLRERVLVLWIVWLALLALGWAQVLPVRLCLQIYDLCIALMVGFNRINLSFSIRDRSMSS
jgi:hypothetical protein